MTDGYATLKQIQSIYYQVLYAKMSPSQVRMFTKYLANNFNLADTDLDEIFNITGGIPGQIKRLFRQTGDIQEKISAYKTETLRESEEHLSAKVEEIKSEKDKDAIIAIYARLSLLIDTGIQVDIRSILAD